jgi:hypothetical protein
MRCQREADVVLIRDLESKQQSYARSRLTDDAAPPAGLFEMIRRTTWPFHIHNPDRTIIGKNTNRVAGA